MSFKSIITDADPDCARFQGSGALMGIGRTVQACPDCDAFPGQKRRRFLAIHTAAEGNRGRLVRAGKHLHTCMPQSPDAVLQQVVFPVKSRIQSPFPQIPYACTQAGTARHIHGSGFQPVRKFRRHILLSGIASGSPIEQGLCSILAQQQTGSLGAQQPLMPRHGDKIRTQFIQPNRQRSGGLGGIQHKGHGIPMTQGGHFRNRETGW